MKKTIIGITIFSFCYPALASVKCKQFKGKTLDATVISVPEGDTAIVILKASAEKVHVRFTGIDTPESKWEGYWEAQPYSTEAKAYTTASLKNKNVKVTFNGDSTYSRCVGEIYINNQSHSLSLVKNGYGWWYEKYKPNRKDLKEAQSAAKGSKLGLWANPNVQAPWDFRGQHLFIGDCLLEK